ncbi:MAG: ras guanine nucleotide exchange factor domain-containing protein [Piptocephalis tieghemiana]|nr:MAG: ras guanine nucleotide exchange factor domain-containing protein [Piptocephalis tieghemiana]
MTVPSSSSSSSSSASSSASSIRSFSSTISSIPPVPTLQSSTSTPTASTASSLSSIPSTPTPSSEQDQVPASTLPRSSAWYLGYDYKPGDVTFNQEGEVNGGTLDGLVERLTLHDTSMDRDLTKAFLLCFRCFCPPPILLGKLQDRYGLMAPEGLSSAELTDWERKKLTPVRFRIFNILKAWLETYFIPEEDGVVLEDMRSWALSVMIPSIPSMGRRLVDLIDKTHGMGTSPEEDGTPHPSPRPPPPGPIPCHSQITESTTVMGVDATELASQLTLRDSRLFCAIRPRELIGQEFSRKSGSLAVNVKGMSTLSTQVGTLVSETILSEPDVRRRVMIIKHFIKLADRLEALHNFDMLFAVMSSLNSSTIRRLRRTWKSVPTKVMSIFDRLLAICDHSRNFAVYRARLRQVLPPCLPFMGLYLTDLTFIDDGNTALRRGTTAKRVMINFGKYMKTVVLLNEIQRFQVEAHKIHEHPGVQAALTRWFEQSTSQSDQETLYQMSLALEPRE